MRYRLVRRAGIAAAAVAALLAALPAAAHCDTLDGPVVSAARQALESGNPNGVLIWVQPADEATIRAAFQQTLAVRRLGPQARDLADRYFFETLVRIHRAGEGAPFTGLKPAGAEAEPGIALADRAIAAGSDDALIAGATADVRQGIATRFAALQRKRRFDPRDLAAGRAYVADYVSFIHYVEAIHIAALATPSGHYSEPDHQPAGH